VNLTIIDLAEVIASGAVILSIGVIAALLYKPTETNLSEQTMPPEPLRVPNPKAADEAFHRVRGGLLRDLQYLPGPFQRLAYIRMVRAEIDAMQHDLGPALHAAAESYKGGNS
jgi:hypothetical protein